MPGSGLVKALVTAKAPDSLLPTIRRNPSMMQPAPLTRETESHGASRRFVGEDHPCDRADRCSSHRKNACGCQTHSYRQRCTSRIQSKATSSRDPQR